MARGEITSIGNVKTKHSKAYVKAREEAEQKIMDMQPKEPPVPMRRLVKEEQELFDNYIEAYPELNIKHSQMLTTLVTSSVQYNKIAIVIRKMDILDPERVELEKRAQAYTKEINYLLKEINNIQTQQFKLAIDMAKVDVEQKKLEQMNGEQRQEVNPLLAVLEATKGFN